MNTARNKSTNTLAIALMNAYTNRNYKPNVWWADESKGGSRPAPAKAHNLLNGPVVDLPRDKFLKMYRNARGTPSIGNSNLA